MTPDSDKKGVKSKKSVAVAKKGATKIREKEKSVGPEGADVGGPDGMDGMAGVSDRWRRLRLAARVVNCF